MKSCDNEDSISVFVFHVRKVFVSVVTGKYHCLIFFLERAGYSKNNDKGGD